MKSFLRNLSGVVLGVLTGFDRMMFRGHLRTLSNPHGMHLYCNMNNVLLKDFKHHAQQLTDRLIATSQEQAQKLGRPIEYFPSAQTRKEDHARTIVQRDDIRTGLIGVFNAVEPCWSVSLRGNRETKKLAFVPELRKCLHLYHYYQHPVLGFMYVRTQTWFPFTVQVGINGREWLTRQLSDAKLKFRRSDNCVSWVEDLEKAQQLLDAQLRVNWTQLLDGVRDQAQPGYRDLLGNFRGDCYWSLTQSEWATDVLFANRAQLQQRYGDWLRFALTSYSSPDVLRFLGQKTPAHGGVNGNYTGEVLSDLGRRVDGLRIKHRAGENAIKMYDKAGGCVLRVETTINDPSTFKVFRTKEGDAKGQKDWHPLRRGVADIHRRMQVSQAANQRYLEALAAVEHKEPLKEVAEDLSGRVKEPGATGRKVRGLNVFSSEDGALLAVVGRPEYVLNGLTNRDVVAGLYPKPTSDAAEQKRRSSRVTRLLRLLRAHGLLHKVPKSHRYRVSDKGRTVITAVLAARNASTEKLVALAA